jgi:hypothetical protein
MSELPANVPSPEIEPMGLREAVVYRLGTLRVVEKQMQEEWSTRQNLSGDGGYDWYASSAQGADSLTSEKRMVMRELRARENQKVGLPYDEAILAAAHERSRYYASAWATLLSLDFPPFKSQEKPIHVQLPPF